MEKKHIDPGPVYRLAGLIWNGSSHIESIESCQSVAQVRPIGKDFLAWTNGILPGPRKGTKVEVFLTDILDTALAVLVASGASRRLTNSVINESRMYLIGLFCFTDRIVELRLTHLNVTDESGVRNVVSGRSTLQQEFNLFNGIQIWRRLSHVASKVGISVSGPQSRRPGVYDDGRTLIDGKQTYRFGFKQALAVMELWEALQKGRPDVSDETLLHVAESKAERLRDLFKVAGGKPHPAWSAKIIYSIQDGFHRLNLLIN